MRNEFLYEVEAWFSPRQLSFLFDDATMTMQYINFRLWLNVTCHEVGVYRVRVVALFAKTC